MAFSNTSDAYDAIMKLFADGWAAAYPSPATPPPVAYPDRRFDVPADNTPWVRLQFQHRRGTQVTIQSPGNRRFRAWGVLTVEIYAPLGDGLTTSQQIGDTLLSIFEGQTTGPDAVIFRQVTPPVDHGPSGAWNLSKVVINFEYDRIK